MCHCSSARAAAGSFAMPIKGHGGHEATQSKAKEITTKAREAAETRWWCMPSVSSADGCTATVSLPHPSNRRYQGEGCRGDAVVVHAISAQRRWVHGHSALAASLQQACQVQNQYVRQGDEKLSISFWILSFPLSVTLAC